MDFQKQKIEHSRLGADGGWEDLPGRWKGNPGVKRVEQAQRTIPIDGAPGWQAPRADVIWGFNHPGGPGQSGMYRNRADEQIKPSF